MTLYDTDPKDLQEENRQLLINGLQEVHSGLDKLIQKAYRQNDMTSSSELRRTRNKVTSMLSEIKGRTMEVFAGRMGDLNRFYEGEDALLKNFTDLSNAVEDAESSAGEIDTFKLESLVDSLEKNYNNRITVTKEVLEEYETRKAISDNGPFQETFETEAPVEPEGVEIGEVEGKEEEFDTLSLSKFYNYLNLLEQKYSRFQPEVSAKGDYIGDNKWKIDVNDKSIRGQVKEGVFKTSLIFETYWHPMDELRDAVEYVQSKASYVGGKYLSLCLINDGWSDEIKNFAKSFFHKDLSLFLYDISNSELIFNGSSQPSNYFSFWHSADTERRTLEQHISALMDEIEYFTVDDVSRISGLNRQGAAKFLDILVRKGSIVDVGLEVPKYTRPKQI